MSTILPDFLLSQLSQFVAARMGLSFPKERWNDLATGIASAARELDMQSAEACARWLTSSSLTRHQIEILASHLTVGETYFFRESRSFEILEERVLPELIRARRDGEKRVRIWSAGCCTGEEPYSIAILLDRLIPDLADWNITILATDINSRFLEKASDGVYGEWSFRSTPAWIRERYFKRSSAGKMQIVPSIKRMVTFSFLNLAEDAYPSLVTNTNAMDVVLCRNVLMYFSSERAKWVIQNLFRSIVQNGWLLVSPTEASSALFPQFTTVSYPDAILYQKIPQSGLPSGSFQTFSSGEELRAPPSSQPARAEGGDDRASEGPAIPGLDASTGGGTGEPVPDPFRRAAGLYEEGRYEEAEKQAIAAIATNPDDGRASALLARIDANRGGLAKALSWCERAIAHDKTNPAYRYLHATVLQETGGLNEAVKSFEQALYLDPGFALAHFALGNLARRMGRPARSAKHFENALSLLMKKRPDDPLQDSEGLTAGRLIEIIRSTSYKEIPTP